MKGWKQLSMLNKPVKGNLIIVEEDGKFGEPLLVLDVKIIPNAQFDKDLFDKGPDVQVYQSNRRLPNPFGDIAFQLKVVSPTTGRITLIIRHPVCDHLHLGPKLKGNPPKLVSEIALVSDDLWRWHVQA